MQIDWLTVAAQIVNFLVLVWLLQRFLYRPIVSAMARREERIEKRLSEAKAAREAVEADSERLRAERLALEAGREGMLDEARQEAATLRSRLEDEVRAEMEARRGTWKAHLADERQAFADRLKRHAGHQVIDIVGRVLRDYAGSDAASQVAGTFLDRLAGLDAGQREDLVEAARRAEGPARVESSVELGSAARSRITRSVRDCVAREIEVEFREDADLLLGIRLTVGERTVEWSAKGYLQRLGTTLDEVVEGGERHRAGHARAAG